MIYLLHLPQVQSSLHDDSDDEVETQADYADSESNKNKQAEVTSREHSLTAIDRVHQIHL